MNKNLRTRSLIIAVVTLVSLILMFGPFNKPKDTKLSWSDFFKPSSLKNNLTENIRLGLDLRGGTHLVLQVQADEAISGITEGNRQKAVDILKKKSIAFNDVRVPGPGQIVVETPDDKAQGQIRDELLKDFGSVDWDVSTRPNAVTFNLKTRAADELRRQATLQARNIIEQRINAFGVAEPVVQLRGREEDHQILVQMPGVDDPERVKQLIRADAKLEFKAVVPPGQLYPTKEAALASLGGQLPGDKQILEINEPRSGRTPLQGFYIVEKAPIITGADLRNAQGVPAQQGVGYNVAFQLKPNGAEKFSNWTGANVGNLLAIVLNDQIKSAPSIKSQISDNGVIEGSFTQQEAEDLGLVLRSGALPAKIVYLEERTVGPSLGADSIRQGVLASIVGLALVVFFMLFYYRLSGVNAVVALVLNLIILLAGLAMFGATLTLPGIAGVILTIGMAVDSNVLIFERIREELRAGRLVASAVDIGFSKALVTIIDTHVTTIVSCLFLYVFGTGPIRGFAVTLVIGLLANLFTAVYVSRTIFIWELNRGGRRAESLSI
ncbi:MAG TPA: protein translocase subunit SecD [Blastocatellia bacterium]|nr:protein translocase subunit SecD [Blastocatellia bacterium]